MVIYYFDRTKKHHLTAHPPGYEGLEVGVFASRSPFRRNKIGMNTVKLLRIEGNRVYTSPMDALDKTPLIDIKPYIKDLDCFPEANEGWLRR
jgi:tRNA-Thr(GGU) m(6)t(6)A37 methyltransferase TsaA